MVALTLLPAGCELNGFLDPTAVGRFQPTPAVLPILDQLDAVDVAPVAVMNTTPVRDEDLIPQVEEYVMGPGDVITVTVYELLTPGTEYSQTRRINELGYVTLPEIGKVKAADVSPSAFEDKIADILRQAGKLKEPSVSVLVQEPHYNTWSLVGEAGLTGVGTYNILSKNFRLLDAIALARGISSQVKTIYVIRQVSLTAAPPAGQAVPALPGVPGVPGPANPTDLVPKPSDLLKDLLPGVEPKTAQPQTGPAAQTQPLPPAPTGMEGALEPGHEASPWAYINGKWVKTQEPGQPASPAPQPQPLTAQRIITIPLDKVISGDPKYNIVIRPGDIVQVPSLAIGNVYVGGQVNRPGTYGLPIDGLTLKQLIFSAGNFAALAVPERTDIIRRVGADQEVTVRMNLKAIFNGTQPDVYLKPNDTINVGTSFADYFAQVVRNGFRASYGFGFTIDRSFDQNLFGPLPNGTQ
jgi:protein involved in polysaccharide export with SLBB domain